MDPCERCKLLIVSRTFSYLNGVIKFVILKRPIMELHRCEECDAYLSAGRICPECRHYNVPKKPFTFYSLFLSLFPYFVIISVIAIVAYAMYAGWIDLSYPKYGGGTTPNSR